MLLQLLGKPKVTVKSYRLAAFMILCLLFTQIGGFLCFCGAYCSVFRLTGPNLPDFKVS